MLRVNLLGQFHVLHDDAPYRVSTLRACSR
jgi:hypothetical protein